MNNERVSGRQLAKAFRVGPSAISKLEAEGIIRRGADRRFDRDEATGAYCESLRQVASGRGGHEAVESLSAARARLAMAQADAAEHKNAVALAQYLPVAEIEKAWGDLCAMVRSQMLALPSRYASQVSHLTRAEIDLLDDEIRRALTELASGNNVPGVSS